MKTIRILLLSIFVVAALALINFVLIPQPQKTFARTYLDKVGGQAQTYSCGPATFHIGVKENPSCSSGTVNGLTTYQSSVDMMLDNAPDNVQYKVGWNWTSYYCDKPWDGNAGCLSNPDPKTGTTILQKGSYVVVSSNNRSLPNACGGFQNDFSFTASYSTDGGKTWTQGCAGGDMTNPGANNATWTYCSSNNNTCSTPTATPTPTTPVTPTPTTPVTPTVTPTATPTVTPTVTPSVCTTPPTCSTPPDGCSYQGGDACTCGQLVCITTIPGCTGSDCNITINVTQNQQQQQQQQMVLAATVAPASSSKNLPSTGAGFEVLGTLLALIPAGLKLRKLV